MGQGACQPLGAVDWQLGVRVERNDKLHLRQNVLIANARQVGGASIAPQQTVKLRQVATLPLPAHPNALTLVPRALPLKKIKAVALRSGMSGVQFFDAMDRRIDQPAVFRALLLCGIGEVTQ